MDIETRNQIMAAAINGVPKAKVARTKEEKDWYDRMVAADKRAKKMGLELDTARE